MPDSISGAGGLSDLLDLASDIAVRAGTLAARRRAEGVEVAGRKSSPVDIVTLADREVETLIRSLLSDARPNDGFFGEESGADRGTSGLTWVVDPIDGTVNYLYGIRHYAVSIAVVEGEPDPAVWRTLAATVADPSSGEVFTATAGGGAYLGDTRLRIPPAVELSQALVGTGFGYRAEVRREQGAVLAGLLAQVRDIRRQGAASLDLCDVAAGRLNAYFERGLRPWDHAAGGLIASESGARVGGLGGNPATQELVLAAAPELADSLEAALLRLGS